MLRTDLFIRTMLYTKLNFGSKSKEAIAKELKIYEDGTMSYVNNEGEVKEIEVGEEEPGRLSVRIYDVQTNEIDRLFTMSYKNIVCHRCKETTVHGNNEGRDYCTQCGGYYLEMSGDESD